MLKRSATRAVVAASLCLGLLVVAGCSGAKNDPGGSGKSALSINVIDESKGDTLPAGGKEVDSASWALYADIQKLDPTVAYDGNTVPVIAQACEGLLRFDTKGELQPNLATDWSNPTPTTYVYNIRPGVTFWDGTPLTADDVAFSLNHYLDPKSGAYMAGYYANVESIAATGPMQVTVTLKHADTQWKYAPAMTGTGAIMQKKFAEEHADTLGDPATLNMCTGPFKFVSWDKGQRIVLARNDDYWNKDRLPKIKNLTFTVIPDQATLTAALNKGEVDGGPIYTVDGRAAAGFNGPLNLIDSPNTNFIAVAFNTTRKPWTDPRVRQAMAMAVDRKGVLASVLNGYGQDLKSFIPPITFTYERPLFEQAYEQLPDYAQDIAKAKQLVQDAGATGASSTLMTDPGTDEKIALFIQQAGQAIGLDIKIQTLPTTQFVALQYASGPKNYDMVIFPWSPDTPDPLNNILLMFDPNNPVSNLASYDNPVVNSEREAGQLATTPEEEAKHTIAAQAQIMQDVPILPVVLTNSLVPLNKRLTGFHGTYLPRWDSWAADLSGTQ